MPICPHPLRQEMALVKARAGLLSTRFEQIHRCAEALKVACLRHRLEEERRSLARTRGCGQPFATPCS